MPIISSQFWLNPQPEVFASNSRTLLLGLIAFFILLSAAAFIFKMRKSFYRKLLATIFNFSLVNVLVGATLFFFNYEQVPFLSSRFWYLLWAGGMIVWAVFIVRYSEKLPQKKKEMIKEAEYKKYLP
jgi:predicted membrane-bound dolichyl-phosphate-mannose-protein mannosyltransferase